MTEGGSHSSNMTEEINHLAESTFGSGGIAAALDYAIPASLDHARWWPLRPLVHAGRPHNCN